MEIDLPSLKRTWWLAGGKLDFQVVGDFGFPIEVEELYQVAQETTETVRTAGEGAPVVRGWLQTPTGWSAQMTGAPTVDTGMAWLERFAWGFRIGAEAKIVGGPPNVRVPRDSTLSLTTRVAYTPAPPDQHPGPRLLMSKPVLGQIAAQAVAWCYQRGARWYFSRDAPDYFGITGPGLEQAIVTGLTSEVIGKRMESLRISPSFRKRAVSLEPRGLMSYQVVDPESPWRDNLAVARRALLLLPQHTNYGFVAYSPGGIDNWDERSVPPAYIDHVERTRGKETLLGSYVLDAWGLMLLTAAHLDRANDLSAWDITPQAGNRHLLQAVDLEPWYAQPTPDPDVIAQARVDFGDMIMTPEVLAGFRA